MLKKKLQNAEKVRQQAANKCEYIKHIKVRVQGKGAITIQAYTSRLPVWQGHLPELCAIYAKTQIHVCCCCTCCSCFPLANKRRRFCSFLFYSILFFAFFCAFPLLTLLLLAELWLQCLLLSKMFFKSEIKNSCTCG